MKTPPNPTDLMLRFQATFIPAPANVTPATHVRTEPAHDFLVITARADLCHDDGVVPLLRICR